MAESSGVFSSSEEKDRYWRHRMAEDIGDTKDKYDALQEEVIKLRVEMGKIQTKVQMWGFIAGLIPTIIGLIINYTMHSK